MAVYRIVGARKVAGLNPGDTITEEQLLEVGANATALCIAGHLAVDADPVAPVATKARKADPAPIEADEAETEEP